jgi:hypothetical protein
MDQLGCLFSGINAAQSISKGRITLNQMLLLMWVIGCVAAPSGLGTWQVAMGPPSQG